MMHGVVNADLEATLSLWVFGLGTSLLKDCDLKVEFVPGGVVTIEQRP